MSGVIAAAVIPHVPTLSRREITPDFQHTLVDGERELGRHLRSLAPDLWVIASTHWVSTFNWFATCQARHEGTCVADEAPDLIPGLALGERSLCYKNLLNKGGDESNFSWPCESPANHENCCLRRRTGTRYLQGVVKN